MNTIDNFSTDDESDLYEPTENYVEVIEDTDANQAPKEALRAALGRGRMRRADCVTGLECNIPSKPGIYRFVDKETGEIEYIGQTINLRRRLQQHVNQGLCNLSRHKILYGIARPGAIVEELCYAEILHIERHKPRLNTYRGGNGRRPTQLNHSKPLKPQIRLRSQSQIYESDNLRNYLREIGRVPLLTREEEIYYGELVQRLTALKELQNSLTLELDYELPFSEWANAAKVSEAELQRIEKDGEIAKSKMVEANLHLVVAIAKEIAKKHIKSNLDLLDLIQEGTIGMQQAVEKYDPSLGYGFSTYAHWWIRQAIFRRICRAMGEKARAIRLPIHIRELGNKQAELADLEEVYDVLEGLGYVADLEEVYDVLEGLDYVIESNPDFAEAYAWRGVFYEDLGNKKVALADYERAIELNPNLANAYYNRGLIYKDQGDNQAALSDFQKARDLYQLQGKTKDYNDSLARIADAYLNRGIVYYKQNNDRAALADYDRVIQLNPDMANAYFYRGLFYNEQGNDLAALADYNRAIQLKPDLADAYYDRGLIYKDQGDKQAALSDFQKARDLYQSQGNAEWYNNSLARINELRSLRANESAAKQSQPSTPQVKLISAVGVDYTQLQNLLADKNWKEADLETLRVMLTAAKREKNGWFTRESIDKFPCDDLRTINQLWLDSSNGRFGFSVQKQIWLECGGRIDYQTEIKLGNRLGWRVNNEWIDRSSIRYSLNALPGHLPVGVGGWEWDGFVALGLGGLFVCVLLSYQELPSLAYKGYQPKAGQPMG